MSRTIILLVGKSGVGKSEVEKVLAEHFGWKSVLSYTTRPPRYEGENTHIFLSDEDFDNLMKDMRVCGYTHFDGYRYCATDEQVESADIYVIDPDGVEFFLHEYRGYKVPIVVYLKADDDLLMNRMRNRGDSEESIKTRIENDKIKFKACDGELYTDYVIPAVNEKGEERSPLILGAILASIAKLQNNNLKELGVRLP